MYLIFHLHKLILIYQLNVFLHEQFTISKYSSILHALLRSQSHEIGFHIELSLQETQSSHLYTHTYIHYDSIIPLNGTHFQLIHICTHTIRAEVKILFHLPLPLN